MFGPILVKETVSNKFQILYNDPPWFYNDRPNPATRFGLGLYAHYEPMTIKQICALPVGDLAEKDSLMYLWVTGPHLANGNAMQALKAWGFVGGTVAFVWVKFDSKGEVHARTGNYTMSNAEFCLVARRGKMLPRAVRNIRQIIFTTPADKLRHSEKPPEARRRIELMYPTMNRIELFARHEPLGWTVIGKAITGRSLEEDIALLRTGFLLP